MAINTAGCGDMPCVALHSLRTYRVAHTETDAVTKKGWQQERKRQPCTHGHIKLHGCDRALRMAAQCVSNHSLGLV